MEQMTPILYMAPLRGVTDHIFRTIYTRHFGGFDLAVAPFLSSKRDSVFKPKYIRDVLPENNTVLPVIPQILSKSAEEFTALANYLNGYGYETVNWNLGCPFPMVTKKQRGSGMLPHTEKIDAFLAYACGHMKGRLSIKVRLGWSDPDDIFRLIPILNDYPIDELVIHPRTGVQRYGGQVDLDAFADCLAISAHKVVYNGDINTIGDYHRLSSRFTGINRWMIGRGCVSNPFLPHEIKSPERPVPDKILKMKAFHGALFDAYSDILFGPSHVMNKMKGFWQYFSGLFEDCERAVKKIKKCRNPEHYLEMANRFFDSGARLARTSSISGKDDEPSDTMNDMA
jgi:tRNA-dihydrouridine synthase